MKNSEKFKTAEERAKAFTKWCAEKQKTAIGKVAKHECSDCPLDEHTPCCFFFWLDLEAEEEKPLPCPFCGSNTVVKSNVTVRHVDNHLVECTNCQYRSEEKFDRDCAIAAHNRVARAVMEAGKDGSNEC